MFSGHNPPTLKHFSRSGPVPDFLHLVFPLRRRAPVHNAYGAFGRTLISNFSGNAASDWPVIAANCVCAQSVYAMVNLATWNT